MAVLPEHQGRGIGRAMLAELCRRLPVDNVILYAVPGKEGFYAACGFRPMKTAMARLGGRMAAPESGYLYHEGV